METTRQIRGKAQKKKSYLQQQCKQLFTVWTPPPTIPPVFPLPRKTTLFHDSSLVSSVLSSFPSGGHFRERSACALVVTAAKLIAPPRNPLEFGIDWGCRDYRCEVALAPLKSRAPVPNLFWSGSAYTSIVWSAVSKNRQ